MLYEKGDLVWFDPGLGYVLPGEVTEFHQPGQVVTVQAVVSGKAQSFTLTNLSSVKKRQDLGEDGVADMTQLEEVNEASVMWNLKIRYERNVIYTYIGRILVSVNPYRMLDIYGLETVRRYEDSIMGILPPHIFGVAAGCYAALQAEQRCQTVVVAGISGSGKTEATKLLLQYLAATNKSPSNLVTEQILESTPLLESFGNAKTTLNDNASRFGKHLEIFFKNGVISGARVTHYLLETSRVISHAVGQRNYHVFYELLAGLGESGELARYGLQPHAQHYFYLNQGSSVEIDGKSDVDDFQSLLSSFQVLGFSVEQQETVFKLLASILHLGNVYFHKLGLKNGQQCVELGSDSELRWLAFLLGVNPQWVQRILVSRTTTVRGECVLAPLSLEQALDMRDSLAKQLYSCLFSWLLRAVNSCGSGGAGCGGSRQRRKQRRGLSLSLLDLFGFENLEENSLEQLCINYANEAMQHQFVKLIFQTEQQEYAREKITWHPLTFTDNIGIVQLIAKKPAGILHVLDDESNFPKASDRALLDKLHFTHALNELYSRSAVSVSEFIVSHHAGRVVYSVGGFIGKNRESLRADVADLLCNSESPMIGEMFARCRLLNGDATPMPAPSGDSGSKIDGRFVTMKPRSPTVATRFHDNLQQLIEQIGRGGVWHVRCIRPSVGGAANSPPASPLAPSGGRRLDSLVLLDQLRTTALVDVVRMRRRGYPVHMGYEEFCARYHPLAPPIALTSTNGGTGRSGALLRRQQQTSSRQLCWMILEHDRQMEPPADNDHKPSLDLHPSLTSNNNHNVDDSAEASATAANFQLGVSQVLMRERLQQRLDTRRLCVMTAAALLLQTNVRRFLAMRQLKLTRSAALTIQSAYRMWRHRRTFLQLRRGVLQAQANFRMQRQRRRYVQMKDEMKRYVLAEREARARGRATTGSGVSSGGATTNTTTTTSSDQLPIPADLATLFSRLPDYRPVHTDKHIARLQAQVDAPEERFRLPHDIDYHSFAKFTNVYFKSHLWGMKREPIRSSFLSSSQPRANIHPDAQHGDNAAEQQRYHASAAMLFKLVLLYMNDDKLATSASAAAGVAEKILADYIVNQGLLDERMRDEILCQLCNQTHDNPSDANCERGWQLMSHCLAAFPPSELLYKYLLKYVSDNGPGGYAADCQKKLLRSPPDGRLSRVYPPTMLEWRCNRAQHQWQMAVQVRCADSLSCHAPLDSWTTGQELAAYVLENRGIGSTFGWTVRMSDAGRGGEDCHGDEEAAAGGGLYELASVDYVLDVIAELEQVTPVHHPSPLEQHPHSTLNFVRAGHDTLKSTPLDGAYQFDVGVGGSGGARPEFDQSDRPAAGYDVVDADGRCRSLDNLLHENQVSRPAAGLNDTRVNTSQQLHNSSRSMGLSGSRLNQRYRSADVLNEATNQRYRSADVIGNSANQRYRSADVIDNSANQRYRSADVIGDSANQHASTVNSWNKYVLSESPLNVRYFVPPFSTPPTSSGLNGKPAESELNGAPAARQGGGASEARARAQFNGAPTSRRTTDVRENGERPARLPHSIHHRLLSSAGGMRSSAMSDTSEAPSLASHVRRVRVPSQSSDMDQYVDELFLPVLDPNLDELSDARSLAASIKGLPNGALPLDETTGKSPAHSTELAADWLPLECALANDMSNTGLAALLDPQTLSSVINGEAEPGTQSANQTTSSFGFQPITGSSGMMSPPAMLLPSSLPISTNQSYSMQNLMPTPSDLAVPAISSGDAQQMALYHRMFLQSAVAQNMQIQQQLLNQNQALTQLLQVSANQSGGILTTSTPLSEASTARSIEPGNIGASPQLALKPASTSYSSFTGDGGSNNVRHRTSHSSSPQTRSVDDLSLLNGSGGRDGVTAMSGALSAQSRARTVRIGRWRWPPPAQLTASGDNGVMSTATDCVQLDDTDNPPIEADGKYQRSLSSDSLLVTAANGGAANGGALWRHQDATNTRTANGSGHNTNNTDTDVQTAVDSVSKLKLSATLKKKLEAVTSSSSSSSSTAQSQLPESATKNGKLAGVNGGSNYGDGRPQRVVNKLDASRRALLERKLVGDCLVDSRSNGSASSAANFSSAGPPPPPPPPAPPVDAPLHVHIPPPTAVTMADTLGSANTDTDSSPGRRGIKSPPRPIQPIRSGRRVALTNGIAADQQLHQSETIAFPDKFEKSDVFSQLIDSHHHHQHDDSAPHHLNNGIISGGETRRPSLGTAGDDTAATKLFGPSPAPFLTYVNTSWTLELRKEVFSPTEHVVNATALHLLFCQIVLDVFNPACIRITPEQRRSAIQYFDELGISGDTVNSARISLGQKRQILETAKQWPTYFCLLFPVSMTGVQPRVQYLGVSHSGIYLIKRRSHTASCSSPSSSSPSSSNSPSSSSSTSPSSSVQQDYLHVISWLSFDKLCGLSETSGCRVVLQLNSGDDLVVVCNKASLLVDIIDRFIAESQSSCHEYVRAITDYYTPDLSLLSFQKGDLIRVIRKGENAQQGWLFGLLDGRRGLFPSQCVVSVDRQISGNSHDKLSETACDTAAASADADEIANAARNGSASPEAVCTDWLVRASSGGTGGDGEDDEAAAGGGGAAGAAVVVGNNGTAVADDGKHSLLQFAILHFGDADQKYNMLREDAASATVGSLKQAGGEARHKKNKKKSKEWTWREQLERVKWSALPLQTPLLKLDSVEISRLAVECFLCIQRFMGDQPMPQQNSTRPTTGSVSAANTEVDCVYSILMSCHRHAALRDEVYCQLMRQTTSNRSVQTDSCQRGWRLLGIIAAYFACSERLRPYLFKYLEAASGDKRRAYHGTATVCLQNLRKTFSYGGRKNVPSVEEITALTAGRNCKRQMYRLPGGTERVINTKSCSVVQDIIEEICEAVDITGPDEVCEFSLYCIVEGDTFTMPLAREEYILDVTTELQKNDQVFYLIFCRSVWYFPLRLQSPLYVEVVFNQITPDYLEGLLLVMPGETLQEQVVYDIARVAALLHRAADMHDTPTMKETKYLLPKAALMVRHVKPPQWVNMVQASWHEVRHFSPPRAKTAVLEILEQWPLFGSSFFAVSRVTESPRDAVEHILALNRAGVHFLDTVTHETLARYPFSEIISTRKVKTEDGTLFLDVKHGNLMVQKVVRIQSDNAHEISRLIRQYISIEQRRRPATDAEENPDVETKRTSR